LSQDSFDKTEIESHLEPQAQQRNKRSENRAFFYKFFNNMIEGRITVKPPDMDFATY